MNDNETLADKISNPIEKFSSTIINTYSEKGIGYIKLLAIIGSVLPILLALIDGTVGIFVLLISFILIALAMKKVDQISTTTKSYKYMVMSLVAYIVFSLVYLFSLATVMGSWGYSIGSLFSHYFIQTIIAIIMSIASTYFYYKSYMELSKATNVNIFKIAAIMMIFSIFISVLSEALSSFLIFISTIFIIIGWYSVKSIGAPLGAEVETKDDEIAESTI
jgi:uncharacterized membrane protein